MEGGDYNHCGQGYTKSSAWHRNIKVVGGYGDSHLYRLNVKIVEELANFKHDTGTRSMGYIMFRNRLRLENYKMISSNPGNGDFAQARLIRFVMD